VTFVPGDEQPGVLLSTSAAATPPPAVYSDRSGSAIEGNNLPTNEDGEGSGQLVTVGEILAAHRLIQGLRAALDNQLRIAKFWEDECRRLHISALLRESDTLLLRAEASLCRALLEDHVVPLYRCRVAVDNAAFVAHRQAAVAAREREKNLSDCLAKATAALEVKLSENKALVTQVQKQSKELADRAAEVSKLRAAIEKHPVDTAHFEAEIAARDSLVSHLQSVNRELSQQMCGGNSIGGLPLGGDRGEARAALVSKMRSEELGVPPAARPSAAHSTTGSSSTFAAAPRDEHERGEKRREVTDEDLMVFLRNELAGSVGYVSSNKSAADGSVKRSPPVAGQRKTVAEMTSAQLIARPNFVKR
jgi:hypothetical protein